MACKQAALKARRLPPDLYARLLDYFIFRYQKAQVADDRDLWTELPYDLQAALALASTESLLGQISMFAEDPPLLERVAMLLKPAYALAGELEQVLLRVGGGWVGWVERGVVCARARVRACVCACACMRAWVLSRALSADEYVASRLPRVRGQGYLIQF